MESSSSMAEWRLREELAGHDEDVRAVAVGALGVITGSRDKSVRLWVEKGGHFELEALLIGHSSFVTTVAPVPAGALEQLPGESIVSGSRDLSVIVWNKETGAPAVTLTGHQYQVSCVAVGKHSEIISTSHDGTIRVYSGPAFEQVRVLQGHEGAVQTVLVLPSGDFLTGGNDATVRLWQGGQCAHTFRGHTDTVRGLALLPDVGVVSASHDMTLRLWDFSGAVMAELVGHTAIVYAAACSARGLIASASEDATARLWSADGACVASIPHPGCVWDVAFLPDGDLVTGCSDFSARVWSCEAARHAPPEAQQALAAAVAAKQQQGGEAGSSADAQLPAGLQLEDAAVLSQPGSHEGQVKVVREAGGGMAYCWSAAEGRWEKVGQVVAGPESGEVEARGSTVDGVAYDHVISVEVDDRPQPLRLGVNRTDNPYTLADSFIERHQLPASYREQIVQYICANTGLANVLPGSGGVNADPFTGGSAYVPGAGGSFPQPGRGQAGGGGGGATGGGADPFTGSSSRQAAPSGLLPARAMLSFASLANPGAVGAKLRSLAASAPPALALSEADAAPGGTLDRLLSSAAAAASGAAAPSSEELQLLGRLLQWPAAALFPALDVARMLALHAAAAAQLAAGAGALGGGPPGSLGAALATAAAEPQLPPNQQTALRLACNCLAGDSGLRPWLLGQAQALLDAFAPALGSGNKGVRTAAATLLLNLAVAQQQQQQQAGELGPQLVSACATLLGAAPAEDEESLLRGVVALGTLLAGSSEAREVAAALECGPLLQRLAAGGSQRVAAAAREAAALL